MKNVKPTFWTTANSVENQTKDCFGQCHEPTSGEIFETQTAPELIRVISFELYDEFVLSQNKHLQSVGEVF